MRVARALYYSVVVNGIGRRECYKERKSRSRRREKSILPKQKKNAPRLSLSLILACQSLSLNIMEGPILRETTTSPGKEALVASSLLGGSVWQLTLCLSSLSSR